MPESILLTSLTGLLILICEWVRKRGPLFDILFFFNASFMVYYVLAPIHLLVGGEAFAALPNIHRDYFSSGEQTFLFELAALVLATYLTTLAGYYAAGSLGSSAAKRLAPVSDSALISFAMLCLTFGGVALAVYVSQFDSLLTAFAQAALIKMGEAQDAGTFAFLRNLIPIIGLVAPLMLVVRLRDVRAGRKKRFGWLIAAMIVVSSVALLTQGSRRAFMFYAFEFYFLLANVYWRTFWQWGAAMLTAVFGIMLFGDIFSLGLAQGQDSGAFQLMMLFSQNLDSIYAALWRDFTYTFACMVAVVDRYDDIPRLFIDVPLLLWDLLPQRLLGLPITETLADHSTLLISEIPVPLIAEVPPGYIGFLWYSGYLPGVIVGGFLYGLIGRLLHNFLGPLSLVDPATTLIYIYAGFCYGYFIREGIPSMIITERFHWFFIAGLLIVGMLRIHGVELRGKRTAREK